MTDSRSVVFPVGVASGGGERLEAALVGVGVAGGVGARALDLAVLAGGPVVVAHLFAVRAGDDGAAAHGIVGDGGGQDFVPDGYGRGSDGVIGILNCFGDAAFVINGPSHPPEGVVGECLRRQDGALSIGCRG